MFLCKKIKHAAMFGLDARIALAVLGVVSLSISLSQEKKSYKEQEIATKQEMRILEAKFLKYWEDLRFKGYGSSITYPTGGTIQKRSESVEVLGGIEKVARHSFIAGFGSLCKADIVHHQNGDTYNQCFGTPRTATARMSFGVNTKDDFYTTGGLLGSYLTWLLYDAASRVYMVYKHIEKEDGAAVSKNSDKFVYNDNFTEERDTWEFYVFNGERFAIDRDVKMYFILEGSVDKYSPSDYILHVVMYNNGKNRTLDTALPKNINELAAFAGASGDDLIHIFNTKDIYLRAKAENLRRLEEIKEKLSLIAETTYLDRITLCSTESTPSSSCDIDNDGDYDNDDKNALLDYNPYPKSSLDTSSAKYYDSTVRYNYASTTGPQLFLNSTLGLPEYYAYDLFGNLLNYQSNSGLKTKGPYTMEVWY